MKANRRSRTLTAGPLRRKTTQESREASGVQKRRPGRGFFAPDGKSGEGCDPTVALKYRARDPQRPPERRRRLGAGYPTPFRSHNGFGARQRAARAGKARSARSAPASGRAERAKETEVIGTSSEVARRQGTRNSRARRYSFFVSAKNVGMLAQES